LEALETLRRLENPPDLILCDIMMPKMDGYEFYQKITENSHWSLIPFIFLTAKASPEDVRLGKMLGADDYIIKPFNDEDLLSSVTGKINRSKKAKLLSKQIEKELLASLKIDQTPSISESELKFIFAFLMVWDEIYGPKLESVYPLDTAPPYDIRQIGTQLFQTKVSLYGHTEYYEAQGVLLKISNIKQDGYIYFDTVDDRDVRGGRRQFMLGILAPKINYLESVRIRDISREIARKIKDGINWEISFYWNQVSKILITPTVDLT
jgi:CheY-like chemotaxis protein